MTMHNSFNSPREKGVVLVVSLILLILITLFAVAAIRSSTTELQIAGNEQIRKKLSATNQTAIEERLNSMADFNNLALGQSVANFTEQKFCNSGGGKCIAVTVCTPVCLRAVPITGGSLVHTSGANTEMTYWEIQAIATDETTNTRVETRQGFRVRMPSGSCPTTIPVSPCS